MFDVAKKKYNKILYTHIRRELNRFELEQGKNVYEINNILNSFRPNRY